MAREHQPDVIVLDLEAERADAAADSRRIFCRRATAVKERDHSRQNPPRPGLRRRPRDQQTLPLRPARSYNRAIGGQSGVTSGADIPVCRSRLSSTLVLAHHGRQECLPHLSDWAWRRSSYCKVAIKASASTCARPSQPAAATHQCLSAQRQRNLPPPRRNPQGRRRLPARRSGQLQRHLRQRRASHRAAAGQRRPRAARPHAAALHRRRRAHRSSRSTTKSISSARPTSKARGSSNRSARSGQPDFFAADAGRQPLAGRRPQQPADHVSHGAGRQPHARHRPASGPHHGHDLRMGRGRSRLHHAHRSTKPNELEPAVQPQPQGRRGRTSESRSAGRFSIM